MQYYYYEIKDYEYRMGKIDFVLLINLVITKKISQIPLFVDLKLLSFGFIHGIKKITWLQDEKIDTKLTMCSVL